MNKCVAKNTQKYTDQKHRRTTRTTCTSNEYRSNNVCLQFCIGFRENFWLSRWRISTDLLVFVVLRQQSSFSSCHLCRATTWWRHVATWSLRESWSTVCTVWQSMAWQGDQQQFHLWKTQKTQKLFEQLMKVSLGSQYSWHLFQIIHGSQKLLTRSCLLRQCFKLITTRSELSLNLAEL